MPNLTVLIGIPASGKSTYRAALVQENPDLVVLSSDDFLENKAKAHGITYGEAFANYVKDAQTNVNLTLEQALEDGSDILWDQTNLSSGKRKAILSYFSGKDYTKTAVVFRTPFEECMRRNEARPEGRRIPAHVMQMMQRNFQEITPDEGFDYVIEA